MGGSTQDVLIGSPMPTTVITGAEQATAGMADPPALSTSGVLSAGKVIAVDLDEGDGNWSTNARLRLRYSADAAGGRPTSCSSRWCAPISTMTSPSVVPRFATTPGTMSMFPMRRWSAVTMPPTQPSTRPITSCSTTSPPPASRRPAVDPPWRACARPGRRAGCDARPLVGRRPAGQGRPVDP